MKKTTSQELQPIQNQQNLTKSIQGEAEILIAQAIDKSVPVETMEKLLAMRRELKAEKAKEDYDRAMAKFQKECPIIEKRKQGYKYKYAPLESIVEQVKSLLSKIGFSYTFDTDDVENAVIVSCKVKHISGHMETSKATIKREITTKMNSSQQSGASMTYGKRYAFVNAFGILTGDEDTDAQIQQTSLIESPRVSQGVTGFITEVQIRQIFALVKGKGKDEAYLHDYIMRAFKKDSIKKLTEQEAFKLIEKIKMAKIEEKEPEVKMEDIPDNL